MTPYEEPNAQSETRALLLHCQQPVSLDDKEKVLTADMSPCLLARRPELLSFLVVSGVFLLFASVCSTLT